MELVGQDFFYPDILLELLAKIFNLNWWGWVLTMGHQHHIKDISYQIQDHESVQLLKYVINLHRCEWWRPLSSTSHVTTYNYKFFKKNFIPGESHSYFTCMHVHCFYYSSEVMGSTGDPNSSSPANSSKFVIGSGDSDVGSWDSCSVWPFVSLPFLCLCLCFFFPKVLTLPSLSGGVIVTFP